MKIINHKIRFKRVVSVFASIATLTLALAGCKLDTSNMNDMISQGAPKHTRTVFAMDTVMDLTVYGDLDAEHILDGAEKLIYDLEGKLSVTDSESEIYQLNETGEATLSSDTMELLKYSKELCDWTGGNLNIAIYPVVATWGFTNGNYRIPEENEIQSLLSNVNYSQLELYDTNGQEQHPHAKLPLDMEIDLGSVAKGYTGDRLIKYFSENGVKNALLNLGGNVQAIGHKPDGSYWKIAITDPVKTDSYLGSLEIADQVVITSGGYQRFFEENGVRYHHIIDPKNGQPANNGLISVTIVGNLGVQCDGLSTALFVMGKESAEEFWKAHAEVFEAIFVDDAGNILITEGLENRFKVLNGAKVQVIRK